MTTASSPSTTGTGPADTSIRLPGPLRDPVAETLRRAIRERWAERIWTRDSTLWSDDPRVQRKIAPKPGGKTYNRNGEGFILGRGLVRCGYCAEHGHDNGLTRGAVVKRTGKTTMRCNARGTGHPTIDLDTATAYVLDYVIGVASHLKAQVAPEDSGETAEYTAARQALARAEKAYAEVKTMLGGTEPPAESAPAVALREAQEAVDAIAEGDAPYEQVFDLTPEQARAMLAMMSITDQRDFVRSVIAKVTLLADTRGLPPAERLTIELQPGIMAANAS